MQLSTRRFICFFAALNTILGLLTVNSAIAAPNFTATDLGALTSGLSQANGLNSTGTVVGFSATSSGMFDGFSWSNGTMTDLGLMPGGTFSEAFGVNDAGLVVGTASDASGNFHAIVWQGGQMTDLGFLSGGNQAVAMAINSNGVIVGYAFDSSNNSHAVIWKPQDDDSGTYSVTDLGTFAGTQAQAVAISNTDMVVGSYTDVSGNSHGFTWSGGVETDLGDLGGGQSFGEGVNSNGVVVGQSMTSGGDFHAFMWQAGQITDLGVLAGSMSGAFAINDSGEIAGESSASDGTSHAVMWQNGAINDLGSFAGENSFASGINASGQIVGQGTFGNFSHGFLLTPVAPPANPPVTTARLDGRRRNHSGWYVSPVSVRLKVTDTGGPGVASTFYTVDGGSQQTYNGPFTISGDGTHTLSYWSVDTLGNAETPNMATVKIDTTPPVTTDQINGNLTSSGWYTGTVTITLNATDATSGVARTNALLDFCHYSQGNGPITVSSTGWHVLYFWSVDVAGNEEFPHFMLFKIDNTPPRMDAGASAKSLGGGNWLFTVSIYANDCGSGLSSAMPSYTVTDNSGPVAPTNASCTQSRPGCYMIQFDAFLPSTVPPPSTGGSGTGNNGKDHSRGGGSSTAHDHVNIALQLSDNVGNTATKTVGVSM
jgi:probable HAF family extracellular repeat protein